MSDQWKPKPGETPIDPSGLLDKSIKTRVQLHVAEAENIRKPILKYLASKPSAKLAPFNYDWLLRLHGEMFDEVWEWAGKVRTCNLNLGVPWELIGQELGGLCMDIDIWEPKPERLIEQSVMLHHRAVRIHPFENGNGRWSRLLANIWLKRHGLSPIEWPEADVGEEASSIRGEYLDAIKQADHHEYGPLAELHERYCPDLGDSELDSSEQ